MKDVINISLLLITLFFLGCNEVGSMVDETKLSKATIVVRARLLEAGEGSKYIWPKIKILKIIKDLEYGLQEGEEINVAHYSTSPSLPEGVSTFYLVPYSEQKQELVLLNKDAIEGISHTIK